MVTLENYEEYILMYVDGELQPAQAAALMEFLYKHPALKKELMAYEQAKLPVDTSITFADKSSLLKPSPVKRTISFPQWRRYSIAAGILAILFISLFRFMETNKRGDELTKTNKTTEQPGDNKEELQKTTQAHDITAIAPDTNTTVHNSPVTSKGAIAKSIVKKDKKKMTAPAPADVVLPAEEAINKTAIAAVKELPGDKPEIMALAAREVPAYTPAIPGKEKKTFWDKLPIDDLKKKKLDNISEGMANTYQEINTTTLTVKVEKRKLILSF